MARCPMCGSPNYGAPNLDLLTPIHAAFARALLPAGRFVDRRVIFAATWGAPLASPSDQALFSRTLQRVRLALFGQGWEIDGRQGRGYRLRREESEEVAG